MGRSRASAALPAALAAWPSFALVQAARRAAGALDEALEPLGMDSRRYGVLAVLAEAGPRSQHVLSQQLGVDRTTMVALVDQLEGLGLVLRKRDPDDRRSYALHLTEDGQGALAEAGKIIAAAERAMFAPLRSDERRTLQELVRRLV